MKIPLGHIFIRSCCRGPFDELLDFLKIDSNNETFLPEIHSFTNGWLVKGYKPTQFTVIKLTQQKAIKAIKLFWLKPNRRMTTIFLQELRHFYVFASVHRLHLTRPRLVHGWRKHGKRKIPRLQEGCNALVAYLYPEHPHSSNTIGMTIS